MSACSQALLLKYNDPHGVVTLQRIFVVLLFVGVLYIVHVPAFIPTQNILWGFIVEFFYE
jgi:hypothetical protein